MLPWCCNTCPQSESSPTEKAAGMESPSYSSDSENSPIVRLRRLADGEGGHEQREVDLAALTSLVKTGELRDHPFSAELYVHLFAFLVASFSWRNKQTEPDHVNTQKAEQIFWGTTRFPEFDVQFAEPQVTDAFIWGLGCRFDGSVPQEEWPFLRDVLLWLYERFPIRRALLRSLLGKTLHSFGRFSHRSVPVSALLQALGPIIRGFQCPLTKADRGLLFEVLLPLHRPNEWLMWDRQTPLISMYHQDLVHCTMLFLEKQPTLAVRCLEAVCSYFPQAREANTPKEVLLISELGSIIKFVDDANFRQILPVLLRHMVRLLGSQNAQPIQAVLQFWKNDHFAQLCKGASSLLIPQLLPILLRGGELFWNPTVNRMTSLVLEKLEQNDPAGFAAVAEEIWGVGRQVPAYELADKAAKEAAEKAAKEPEGAPEGALAKALPGGGNASLQDVSSMKFRMGGWKPSSASSGGGKQPPLTTTGVAPWAFQGGGAIKAGPLSNMQGVGGGGAKQPPLTTTGVAPWAFENKSKSSGPLTAMGRSSGSSLPRIPKTGVPESIPPKMQTFQEDEDEVETKPVSGIDRVHEYMKRLNPKQEVSADAASWEAALMAEAPTLLPNLKFHELVFVHEALGTGAFSVCKYARAIQKGKTQSQWPEYAVKVIDTKTMVDLGYEVSVNREICVLRMLSHPGIARLVSSFRWRDGAYLVLEYASKGDLHSILVRQGKLSEEHARFYLGETIAALNAIHQIGFVYADLKPENIVVTSAGHAKLTDFGGCRPITKEAREKTQQSLLSRLRNGDWKCQDDPEGSQLPAPSEEALFDESRVEGTTLYLPPEVIRGAPPTLATDAWALGCLTYQMLTGRPPIWSDSEKEEDLRSRIVSFKFEEETASKEDSLLSEPARSLVSQLMHMQADSRLSMAGAAEHAFFEGVNVFTLYQKPRGPELESAPAAPPSDARWQKRQFSKIWTVVPTAQDYTPPESFGSAQAAVTIIAETSAECDAPFGEEMAGSCAPSGKLPTISTFSM